MSVFTFFNHGTKSHRDDEGEVVAEFGRLASGHEYRDFLILDGPGSQPKTAPTPGQFNPFTRNKSGKRTFGKTEMGHTHYNWAVTGLLTGSGWNDNVMHAVAALAEVEPLPKTVNMIGWSRGAVTCTKLAYVLREFFPQIDVNIFAVDPVAGAGNKGDTDASTIRSNVKNYLAVLSMHETRGGFKPQSIKRVTFTSPGTTNAIFLPFPGNHSGQVALDKTCKKGIGESAQIVWFLAMKFLQHFGTRFETHPSPSYSAQEICNYYAKMKIKMPSYEKSSPGLMGALMGGRKTRDFLKNRRHQYVKHSAFFINEHHRRALKRAYPALYMYVFEDQGSNVTQIGAEFRSTRYLLALHQVLEGLGFQDNPLRVPIRGGGREAVRMIAEQHTASLGLMGLY